MRLSKALMLLDRILEPERAELRYFDFLPDWGGGSLATMDSGEGDFYRIWFLTAGTVVCGLDPAAKYAAVSSERRNKEVFAGLPRSLARARMEFDDVTFACWAMRRGGWAATPCQQKGRDPDGSARLLLFLDGQPETYVRHAREYFGTTVPVSSVRRIYEGTIDAETVSSLSKATAPRPILALARRLGLTVSSSTREAAALPPAPLRKALAHVPDPVSLAKRLMFMTLVDALVAPRARAVRLLNRKGRQTSVALGAKGELRISLDGAKGCLTTGPLPDSLQPSDLARWTSTARTKGALTASFDGRSWRASAWGGDSVRLLDALQPNYLAWARRLYGRSLPTQPVTLLWQQQPLTSEIVSELGGSLDWEQASAEAARLGWRVKAPPRSRRA